MNGSPTGGDAYDYFVSKPHKKQKGEKFVSVSSTLTNDCICDFSVVAH